MIKVSFKKSRDWPTLGQSHLRELRRFIMIDLIAGLRQMHESILLTPVYTGRTLVNYRWSLNSASNAVRAPVAEPDLPGTTSGMGLGQEPRRRANAAIVDEEFRELLRQLRTATTGYPDVYLVNNTSYFDLVEYGTYSEGARTPPGGMVRRGETIIEATVLGLRRVSGGV